MPGNSKRRRRKHRGTQTGSLNRRARSRPRNRQEAMAQARSRKGGKTAARAPIDRRAKPPTWKGSATRGILFAALLLPISLLFGQELRDAIVLTVIAAAFYVPLGFWTESFFHRRYMARLQRERVAAAAEKAQHGKRTPREEDEAKVPEESERATAGKDA